MFRVLWWVQKGRVDAVAIQEGEDVKLAFGSYAVKLPEQKAARLVEGGYIGKEVVLGIRPEDIKDEEIFVNGGSDNVLDATVKVYTDFLICKMRPFAGFDCVE